MGFFLTILEIFVAFILIIGFFNEEKVAYFEQKAARIIKRKIRRFLKKKRGGATIHRPPHTYQKYCA
jgi:hypothetical protein